MNKALDRLHPYPFEKLAALRDRSGPTDDDLRPIDLSIGEPRHPAPHLILDAASARLIDMQRYPTTAGSVELREAIARWLTRRYNLPPGSVRAAANVLPLNGTREGLFAIAQCVVDSTATAPLVMMPNPFYQIYEGAALLAGAEPRYLDMVEERGYLPRLDDVTDDEWQRCQLFYLCSPGNPAGNVLPEDFYATVLGRARRHDFVVVADECYAEIYDDEARPPTGLLAIAAQLGSHDYARCLVFHSLSKRSSVPGMRSGFCVGDAELIARFLRYRTYHGSAMPLHHQAASIAAWNDEAHVLQNRLLYRQKFDAVLPILRTVLPVSRPAGGFYLWPRVPGDDVEFASTLLRRENVTVLPGSFLGRGANGLNPGAGRVRIALVPALQDCVEAAHRIRRLLS